MNMIDGNANVGPCLPPCQQLKFDTRVVRNDPRDGGLFGLFVQFENTVTVHQSSFVIDEITLLTRIGGIIGVGKEFFWILVFIASTVKGLAMCLNKK